MIHHIIICEDNDTINIKLNEIGKTYSRYEMQKLIENETINSSNIQFIPSFPIDDDLLLFLFSKIQIARKKDLLNKSLQENFDENILEFDIILGEPKLFVLNREEAWVALSEFGEGIKRIKTNIGRKLVSIFSNLRRFLLNSGTARKFCVLFKHP
jgi:hypothetical protein